MGVWGAVEIRGNLSPRRRWPRAAAVTAADTTTARIAGADQAVRCPQTLAVMAHRD
ncbi:hypothetical protein [Nonomuraea turcica]|uniref:hypothetical protein n=1 Tax=Nonomuraea sp. G32 TaxID=3067274 RepID=UPI00273B80BD|nr:hypothetical protein [Nonomuraea sp. G32]MDP4511249.1 hypothetical protein [Nonomuraea sp. G32]